MPADVGLSDVAKSAALNVAGVGTRMLARTTLGSDDNSASAAMTLSGNGAQTKCR